MHGERMHRPGKLLGERFVDEAVPLDPALPDKRRRDDVDPEMGLAPRTMTGVAGMQVRLVVDPQALGGEPLGQLLFNTNSNRHDAKFLHHDVLAP